LSQVSYFILNIIWLFFGCQYQRNRLPCRERERLDSEIDLLLVDVNLNSTHYSLFNYSLSYPTSTSLKPRLHQGNMLPATCVLDEQLVSVNIYVDGHILSGNKLLVRDTCRLYLGNIIAIHLCHGRLVSLCIQRNRRTTNWQQFLLPIQETCYQATCCLV